jgi:hypothetical protein
MHKGRAHRITADAAAAFRACDRMALHRALGLKPWQPSPLDVDPHPPRPDGTAWAASWSQAVELRQELLTCP